MGEVMSEFELICTGIVMGVLHVLTGPDHLSALMTLSANVAHFEAFVLGVRWGIGHSAGLLFVGGILIAISEEAQSESITISDAWRIAVDSCVGVFMICLGTYGMCRAFRRRDSSSAASQDCGEDSEFDALEMERINALFGSSGSRNLKDSILIKMQMHLEDDLEDSERENMNGYITDIDSRYNSRRLSRDSLHTIDSTDEPSLVSVALTVLPNSVETRTHSGPSKAVSFGATLDSSFRSTESKIRDAQVCMSNPNFSSLCENSCSPETLAIATGLVHGIAGPGSVLGVIPAVKLQEVRFALLYLGTFCITSTLVMGGFAAFYGTLSERFASWGGEGRVFKVEVWSSSLSVFVGIVWLVLLAIGHEPLPRLLHDGQG